jgi:hypothetical protein
MNLYLNIQAIIIEVSRPVLGVALVIYAYRCVQWLRLQYKQRREVKEQATVLMHIHQRQAANPATIILTPGIGNPMYAACEALVTKGQLSRAMLPGGYCMPGRVG